MNAIGTEMRDSINSGLTLSMMAVSVKREEGMNKHQVGLGCREWAG